MDITGAILLTGIGLVVGFLFALLFFSLRRGTSPEPQSRERVLTDSEQSINIWREGKDHQLVVEVGGVSHYKESDLEKDQSRLIVRLISELQTWMDVSPSIASPSQPEIIKPDVSPSGEETKRTSLNPLEIFSRTLQPAEKTKAEESDLNIVSQIDEILQVKLENNQLEDKGIRLIEGPDQGIVIEVGLNRYTEIEAVPDERVRQLIRQSVSEWESSLGDQSTSEVH
jgi:hypothetical protein